VKLQSRVKMPSTRGKNGKDPVNLYYNLVLGVRCISLRIGGEALKRWLRLSVEPTLRYHPWCIGFLTALRESGRWTVPGGVV